MVYACGMDYITYVIIKFCVLVGLVFIVGTIYAAVTGQTLEQARRDREAAQRSSKDPAKR